MRGVRFTKAEATAVRDALDMAGRSTPADSKGFRTFAAARIKLEAAMAPGPASVNPGPIEEALIRTSRGRVIKLEGQGGYARASKQATQVGATEADAALVGEWLARQGWWKQGPTTILTVLTRWPEWLAKAKATQPPPSLKEGLNADARSGTEGPSEGVTTGRSARGFR